MRQIYKAGFWVYDFGGKNFAQKRVQKTLMTLTIAHICTFTQHYFLMGFLVQAID